MKQCLIIILLLLSACSPKNTNLPVMSQQDTKSNPYREGSAKLKEGLTAIYAVSPKGEVNLNAEKGNAYVKWDEQGVTIFLSGDFVPKPGQPLAENVNKFLTQFHQSVYSNAEGKMFIPGTDVYFQFDDKGITLFVPKTAGVEAQYDSGVAHYNKGQYDEAISDFSKVLEISPRFAEAYRSRGSAYDDKGQYDEAILDYNKALEMNPRDARTYCNRGILYEKKGQYDQAISDYTKALEMNPRDAWTYYNRGILYEKKGQYDQAISDYNKGLEINPICWEAYNNLAWVLATANVTRVRNGEKALKLALKACELTDWKNPDCLDTLAAAYAREEDFENAVKWEEKAMESAEPAKRADWRERLECYKQRRPWPSD